MKKMKHKTIYFFSTTECGFKPMLKTLEESHAMFIPWVDYEPESHDYEEEAQVRVHYPNDKYPELTKKLFFEIVCKCYPNSYASRFNIEISVLDEEGSAAVEVKEGFCDMFEDWKGNFKYKGESFSKDLQRKINEVKKIVNNI
jgi:hypothetical protein